MVNKVVGHKPHSIYFVEGANALSRESGILKSALEQVGIVLYLFPTGCLPNQGAQGNQGKIRPMLFA